MLSNLCIQKFLLLSISANHLRLFPQKSCFILSSLDVSMQSWINQQAGRIRMEYSTRRQSSKICITLQGTKRFGSYTPIASNCCSNLSQKYVAIFAQFYNKTRFRDRKFVISCRTFEIAKDNFLINFRVRRAINVKCW